MARPVLRAASVALAGGAGLGVVFGCLYMWRAIEGWNRPGLSGVVAGWAVLVWFVCAGFAALAWWTWRTTFKKALIALIVAGIVAMYWAVLYVGHDFTPWTSGRVRNHIGAGPDADSGGVPAVPSRGRDLAETTE
jgi:hypothetical protein